MTYLAELDNNLGAVLACQGTAIIHLAPFRSHLERRSVGGSQWVEGLVVVLLLLVFLNHGLL